MKKLILFLITLSICFSTKGQSISMLDDMINKSLSAYLNKRKEQCDKGILSKSYFDNLYILSDYYPQNFTFSKEILDMNLKYASLMNISCQKELKAGREYDFIFSSISLDGNKLSLSFSDKKVIIDKNNNLKIAVSDFGTFVYEYSCEKQKWTLIETKYGGV